MFTRDLNTGDSNDAVITDAQSVIFAFNPDTEQFVYHGPTRASGITIDWISDCKFVAIVTTLSANLADDMSQQNYGIIIGLPVGLGLFGLIVFLVALVFYYKNQKLDLSPLPPDVRWQYEQYQRILRQSPRTDCWTESSNGWEKRGTDFATFYTKKLERKGSEWANMSKLLEYFQWDDKLVIDVRR